MASLPDISTSSPPECREVAAPSAGGAAWSQRIPRLRSSHLSRHRLL